MSGDGEETVRESDMFRAAKAGNAAKVRRLIAAGADVNEVNSCGRTVLMEAVTSGDRSLKAVRLLVEAGADALRIDRFGNNLLHEAVDAPVRGDDIEELFPYLCSLGIAVDAKSKSGSTPLSRAVHGGMALEVRVLCALGADPNQTAMLGESAEPVGPYFERPMLFHATIFADSPNKVAALLDAGADPLAVDERGRTPLVFAIQTLYGGWSSAEPKEKAKEFVAALRAMSGCDTDRIRALVDELMLSASPEYRQDKPRAKRFEWECDLDVRRLIREESTESIKLLAVAEKRARMARGEWVV